MSSPTLVDRGRQRARSRRARTPGRGGEIVRGDLVAEDQSGLGPVPGARRSGRGGCWGAIRLPSRLPSGKGADS